MSERAGPSPSVVTAVGREQRVVAGRGQLIVAPGAGDGVTVAHATVVVVAVLGVLTGAAAAAAAATEAVAVLGRPVGVIVGARAPVVAPVVGRVRGVADV